jgi:peptide/nickel transport system substrate-binding protein
MNKRYVLSVILFSMVILLNPLASLAANPTTSTTDSAKASSTAAQPQTGSILKIIMRTASNVFGYPPRIVAAARDYAPPFFDHLIRIGDDGKYKPDLALSWDISKDGKAITFKLRQGVKFHDGTLFNAQAVKANLDNLIPPNGSILSGITSVDIVDDDTVRLNLLSYNNLILYHFANNPATYMYSPEALKKNGADWATTHPVGTGAFMLKDYQPNISLRLVKNPNYWQKGLPYLDGIEMPIVADPMTQIMTFKAGQADAIYDAELVAAQLRDDGYPLQMAPGSFVGLCFDTKNSEIFAKLKVREAIEYAIDKEAICNGPGHGLYKPMYQNSSSDQPDYNKACPPRKYDPAKTKKLLAEAGYPNGFSFKMYMLDSSWKDGLVAIQSYLDKVGIKMDINYLNVAAFNLIRQGGKIEKGAASYYVHPSASNTLYLLDNFWRSDIKTFFPFVVRPAGIDDLIDKAKLSRDPAAVAKINQQILKLIYDDEAIVPLWLSHRIVVVDKSVQNTGWFINGDPESNEIGIRTWLKK